MYFGLAIAGVILHIGMKFRDEITKNPDKSFIEIKELFQWRKHLFRAAVSVVIAGILVGIRDEIADIYPITKITAVFLGYAADSVFKNIVPENLRDA